jgi:hypothetical protein
MACTDPNCNTACNCNQCCPPTPPPVPPTPPVCIGTQCEEVYDAACVNYSGPAIECMGITVGLSLNNIIQLFAAKLCDCCSTVKCINPIEYFFTRVAFWYNIKKAETPAYKVADAYELITKEGGLTLKKCDYCCPDGSFYGLILNNATLIDDLTNYNNGVLIPISEPCTNCQTNYNECATTFLTLFDPTLNGTAVPPITSLNISEFAGFNGESGLCTLNTVLPNLFTYNEITSLMQNIKKDGFIITCDSENGNLWMGSLASYGSYICNMSNECLT